MRPTAARHAPLRRRSRSTSHPTPRPLDSPTSRVARSLTGTFRAAKIRAISGSAWLNFLSVQSALDAISAGFAVGTRTMLDVLIQQRNLYQVKRDYAKTRYDYTMNSLTLKKSTGDLSRNDLEMVNRWLSKQ